MWYAFALLSAVLYSFRGVLEKRIIHRVNQYILGLAIRLFALPFFAIPLAINPSLVPPLNTLTWKFWFPVLFIGIISTQLETYFYYKALKDEEISLVLPILSLAPVLTMVFAFVVFRDIPTLFGALGVMSILFGIYALKLGHAREGILQPIYHLKGNQGVRLMLIVMTLLAFSSVLDKLGVTNSNAYFFAFSIYLTVSVSLAATAYIKARTHFNQLRTHFGGFTIIGVLVAGYTLPYMIALQSGNVAYITAIRNASILFTIIFSYFILRERNIRDKLIAASLIFAGLIAIKVFG